MINAARSLAALPGPRGIDHLRAGLGFVQNPYAALLAQYREHGPVLRIGFGKLCLAYLFGPEANKLVFTDRAESLRFREAYEVLVPITGETALIVSDAEQSRRRRRLVQPAFQRRRVNAYLRYIQEALDATLRTFRAGQTIDIYDSMRATVRRIVIRSLFGERLATRSDELGMLLQDMLDFVNQVFIPQIKLDIPGLPYHKFLRAKRSIDTLVYDEIRRRRATPDEGDDVMALLLAARDETGDSLSDVEVRDQVVSLITAGFETTSASVGWAIYAMLNDPGVWDRVQAEVTQVTGDDPIAIEHLDKMEYLDRVISEVLRLYPSVFIGVRKATEDLSLLGHTIPKGNLIAYSPYITHRIESIWPDAERFDPERWNPQSPGYRPRSPYEYVPFGGGARHCIGMSFALLDLKVMLAELTRKVRFTLLPQTIIPTGLSAMYPKGGLTVRIDSVLDTPR